MFPKHKLDWTAADKPRKEGRPSGGSVLGIKQTWINDIKTIQIASAKLFKLEMFNILVYPIFLNYNQWENNFYDFNNVLLELNDQKHICIGDFNGRISDLGALPENIDEDFPNIFYQRQSKDEIINQRGRRLLETLEDHDLIIMNGRCKGDNFGEFTFINKNGNSVIDLACVNSKILGIVKDFEVIPFYLSDHMPVVITLARKECNVHDSGTTRLLPKLRWKEECKETYRLKLTEEANNMTLIGEPEHDMRLIVNSIYNSSEYSSPSKKWFSPKQPWFDKECAKYRRKVFQLLNLFRKNNLNFVKQSYLIARKEYKEIIRDKRRTESIRIVDEMAVAKDASTFWKIVNTFKKKSFKIGKEITAPELVYHFKTLFNQEIVAYPVQYAEPYTESETLDRDFTMDELQTVLRKAKNNKAPGTDRIPYEHLKNAPPEFLDSILKIFNSIYQSGNIPKTFKETIIFPIFKKGDINEASNYRGISFMNTIAKVFTGLLLNRLIEWLEENRILKEFQAGFRKGYGTVDQIFNLCCLAEIVRESKKKKLYCLFVDFSAAFDRVDRKALWYKLYMYGISSKFIKVLKNVYEDTCACVWCNNSVSDYFNTEVGLRQGCLLSPILFSLFLNDLEDVLGYGCAIQNRTIRLLAYVDDVTILANTPEDLQVMIDNLEHYCNSWNQKINMEKTKIMIFGNGRRRTIDRWRSRSNEPIEVVNKFKYLGVWLTPKVKFETDHSEKLRSAKAAINITWNNVMNRQEIGIGEKLKIFNSTANAIILYGAQVWGFRQSETVEKLMRFFIRKILWLPKSTPNYALQLETGWSTMFATSLTLHLKYIRKVLAMPGDRLPHFLAQEIINLNLFWNKELTILAAKHNIQWTILGDTNSFNAKTVELLLALETAHKNYCLEQARKAKWHVLYGKLTHPGSYLTNCEMGMKNKKAICRARCEEMNLNFKPWRTETQHMCSLCNLGAREDMEHFLGICPVLKEFRLLSFGKPTLANHEIIEILNGKSWSNLISYLRNAGKYRTFLVAEFNI